MQGCIDINEAVIAIKKAGARKVRATPMPDQNVHSGNYQIEILEDRQWRSIVQNVPKSTAENLITQATSRVLLG